MNFNKQIYTLFEKQQFTNPLEEARQIVAPLCMNSLNDLIINCDDCRTMSENKNIAYGNPNANIMIIDDVATNNREVKDYFDTLIEASGLDKNDLFIINSVSCVCQRRVKGEMVDRLPSKEETNSCKAFLNYAIQFVRPRIIIAMGATALNMFHSDVSLLSVKNTIMDFNGIKTIVSYSVKDIFSLSQYQSEEESQLTADEVLSNLVQAKEYIDSIRSK